ncbi:putative 28S ribosomal protein S16, mitochondrial [Halotydeus destructor]|nr:putative 28S ribosomal protein S16, mitochondrial [Halotydeus destructor]
MKPMARKASIVAKHAIRIVRMGCVNRPFYQIGVMPFGRRIGLPADEVIGSFDPMANERNEKLFSMDLDRLAYWIGEGAHISDSVSKLLGQAGFLPIHHRLYQTAWRTRIPRLQEGNQASNSSESTS